MTYLPPSPPPEGSSYPDTGQQYPQQGVPNPRDAQPGRGTPPGRESRKARRRREQWEALHVQQMQYGQPAPGYGPPPGPGWVPSGCELRRKKPIYKRVWFWSLVVVIVIVIVIIAAATSAVNKGTNAHHTVVYQVTSDAKTSGTIDYLNINGDGTSGSEQADGVALPWRKTVSAKGDWSAFTLTAQAGDAATTISCKITVDGKVRSQQTSHGQFALVSCSTSGG